MELPLILYWFTMPKSIVNQYNIHVDIFISETLFSSGFRQKYILGVTVQQYNYFFLQYNPSLFLRSLPKQRIY